MGLIPKLEHVGSILLIAGMVAVGGFGWWLRLGPEIHLDTSPLEYVPAQIGGWMSRDIPLADVVESELRADYNLQRAYFDRIGQVVWVYVGYYGTERGGRPEHTPRGCYTGAGWGIESSRTVDVDPNGTLRANEYLVTKGSERRLVHFWYRSHRRTGILGGLDQNVDRFMGRLFDSRADGALVRVSTRIEDGDIVSARGRLLSFSSLLDPVLGEHWPSEILSSEPALKGASMRSRERAESPPPLKHASRAQRSRFPQVASAMGGGLLGSHLE